MRITTVREVKKVKCVRRRSRSRFEPKDVGVEDVRRGRSEEVVGVEYGVDEVAEFPDRDVVFFFRVRVTGRNASRPHRSRPRLTAGG